MKYIIATVLAACVQLNASTWTFHNFKDNYLAVSIFTEWTQISCGVFGYGYAVSATWDFWGEDYGGLYGALQCDGAYGERTSGYSDSRTFTFPVGELGGSVVSGGGTTVASSFVWLAGHTSLSILTSPCLCSCFGHFGGREIALPPPGEYWIDFASDTSSRVSNSEPADFGKWAWDGSINPSWVEPVAPLDASGKKIGHRNKK